MNRAIWQKLLSLESRDITQQRFEQIHSRTLNARRAREINAAARQAREYFRNGSNSDHSVRPLLTFYGVASLSRALLLLLKPDGGEEGLNRGHGIEAVRWGEVVSGGNIDGLPRLNELRICVRSGLFSDFMKYTRNRMSMHIRSGGVDWRFCYDLPDHAEQISVGDLFSRIPDLWEDYSDLSDVRRHVAVQDLSYSEDNGLQVKIRKENSSGIISAYQELGYAAVDDGESCALTCSADRAEREIPQFVHTYVNKMFGAIPKLFIAEPFPGGARYSQLCMTYMVSFVLGMLVRYFPTHWIALVQGEKGDSMWPTIVRAQQVVEESYPELVAEMIRDASATGH
ncbi:MAG: hypothetical protein F4X22_13855 [Gemmatimonadales bacterium]|nr:hypothetical protein [Candidatus Palauibacter denitrificans]